METFFFSAVLETLIHPNGLTNGGFVNPLNPIRVLGAKARRSSDRWIMRFLVLGWLLMGFTLLFLVLVWLDASIAGRVIDYLF
jgi:hypothetical protein